MSGKLGELCFGFAGVGGLPQLSMREGKILKDLMGFSCFKHSDPVAAQKTAVPTCLCEVLLCLPGIVLCQKMRSAARVIPEDVKTMRLCGWNVYLRYVFFIR